jgi:hypothetical protein
MGNRVIDATMKNSFHLALIVVLIIIVIAGLLTIGIVSNRKAIENSNRPTQNPETAGSNWNAQPKQSLSNAMQPGLMKNLAGVSTQTNAMLEFWKTATDPNNGQYVAVNCDKSSVVSRNASGDIIWSNNIVPLAQQMHAMFFNGKIDSLVLVSNILVIYAGNAYFEIDKQSGKITSFGTR